MRVSTWAIVTLFYAYLPTGASYEWQDTPILTDTWKAISDGDFNTLLALVVSHDSDFVHHRSADGRGPMWWAYEFSNPSALALLQHFKVTESETDVSGLLPSDTFTGSEDARLRLVADAKQRVPGIPVMLQQFADKLEEMKQQQAERFDDDAAFSSPIVDMGDQEDDYGDDEYDDDEDEDEDEQNPAAEDISAKIAALKAKAQEMKDEV
mmetsp:Transcript_8174/g.21060  ORF Transcript_8174/g.21060 Transcript_8174/m.21060 type:complete len:209 (-) Transcript_8174:364-990(-)